MIGKLLGHTQPQITARHAHLTDDPLRSTVQQIDTMLEVTITGGGPSAPTPATEANKG